MSDFTSGPWSFGKRGKYRQHIDGLGWGSLAKVVIALNDGEPESSPEGVANANLIVSAPDLYAALEAVELARNSDAPADWKRATKLSAAALARARGQS